MKTTSMRVTDLRRTTVSLRAIVIAASFLVPIRGQEFFESFEPPLDFLYCYVSAGFILGPMPRLTDYGGWPATLCRTHLAPAQPFPLGPRIEQPHENRGIVFVKGEGDRAGDRTPRRERSSPEAARPKLRIPTRPPATPSLQTEVKRGVGDGRLSRVCERHDTRDHIESWLLGLGGGISYRSADGDRSADCCCSLTPFQLPLEKSCDRAGHPGCECGTRRLRLAKGCYRCLRRGGGRGGAHRDRLDDLLVVLFAGKRVDPESGNDAGVAIDEDIPACLFGEVGGESRLEMKRRPTAHTRHPHENHLLSCESEFLSHPVRRIDHVVERAIDHRLLPGAHERGVGLAVFGPVS